MEDHYLTVGRLKEVLQELSDDTPVYYERVEDVYFNKYSWKADLKVPDDFDKRIKSEYLRAFCAYRYEDKDKPTLCITAHY